MRTPLRALSLLVCHGVSKSLVAYLEIVNERCGGLCGEMRWEDSEWYVHQRRQQPLVDDGELFVYLVDRIVAEVPDVGRGANSVILFKLQHTTILLNYSI